MFAAALSGGGEVRGINAGARALPRSELDALTELARQHGARGLVWAFVQEDGWRSPIAKFLKPEELTAVTERLGAQVGDLLLIVADQQPSTVGQALGALRLELARRFDLVPDGTTRHPLGDRVPDVRMAPRRGALGCASPPLHGADGRPVRSGRTDLPRLRPGARRRRDRGRVDPHQPARCPAARARADRHRRRGGPGTLRLSPRRTSLRRAAARRYRDGDRPDRGLARPDATRSAR